MLDDVTVNGGIVIDPSGRLEISDGSVSGGINAGANAELDINHDLGGGTRAPGRDQGQRRDQARPALDYDIISAEVSGGIKVTGDSPFAAPELCGNDSQRRRQRLQLLLVCGVFIGIRRTRLSSAACRARATRSAAASSSST